MEYGVGVQVLRLSLKSLRAEGRVIAVPRRGYRVNQEPEVFSATHNLIAIVLANPLQNHFANQENVAIQRGIESVLSRPGYPFLVLHGRLEHLRFAVPPDLEDLSLRGVLLVGPFRKEALLAYEKLPVPVVLVDRPPERFRLSSVSVDNEAAACDAVHRLLGAGHWRIALVRRLHLKLRDIDADSRERQAGFFRALKEAGLGRPRDAVFDLISKRVGADRGIRAMIGQRPRFTAVLAVDVGAAGMIEDVCTEAGLAIPRDLSVVAFQDTDNRGPWSGPQTDFFQIGRRAALLMEGDGRTIRHERVPAEWKEGRTFGVPR
jgi:DNA-binding LacI/PurR family transcriptional regulator